MNKDKRINNTDNSSDKNQDTDSDQAIYQDEAMANADNYQEKQSEYDSPRYIWESMEDYINSNQIIYHKVKNNDLKCDRCSHPFAAALPFYITIIEDTGEAICNRCDLKSKGTSPEKIMTDLRNKFKAETLIEKRKEQMELNQAYQKAQIIQEKLRPFCEIINIAGSIRRMKPDVKDIEIVALPKTIEEPDGFFEAKQVRHPDFIKTVNGLGKALKGKVETGRMVQIQIDSDIKLDLFIPQKEDYYRQYAIRTGSADYSGKTIAAGWKEKGWCGTEDGLRLVSQCKEVSKNKWVCIVDNPTLPPVWQSEEEFFEWINIEWVEPEKRNL